MTTVDVENMKSLGLEITVKMDEELELEFKSIRNRIQGVKLENELLKSKIYTLENNIKIKGNRIRELEEQLKELEQALAEIYDGE